MGAHPIGKKTVFRHGTFNTHPRLATGIFLCLLAFLFVAELSTHSWLGLIGVCTVAVLLYAMVAYAKFELWENGFSHRDLSGTHVLEFAQIEDAVFETVCFGDGYAAVLSLRLKGEARRKKIPIGGFGVQADALLFTALERYGIPIRQDGTRLVESAMQQIREAQSTEGRYHRVRG